MILRDIKEVGVSKSVNTVSKLLFFTLWTRKRTIYIKSHLTLEIFVDKPFGKEVIDLYTTQCTKNLCLLECFLKTQFTNILSTYSVCGMFVQTMKWLGADMLQNNAIPLYSLSMCHCSTILP